MRAVLSALALVASVLLASCYGSTEGGDNWVKIPAEGRRRARDLNDATLRATAWCKQHGLAGATFDGDGDGRFYRFTCKP